MVPAASHLTVPNDARAGRRLLAEQQVVSLYGHHRYLGDLVSHHALVRDIGGYAATHAKGTGTARAFRALLPGRPWVVVTVPALVLRARW